MKPNQATRNNNAKLDAFKLALIRLTLRKLDSNFSPYIRDCFIATRCEVSYSTVYRVKTGVSYTALDTKALEGTEGVRRAVQRLVACFLSKADRILAKGVKFSKSWRQIINARLFAGPFLKPRQQRDKRKPQQLSPAEALIQAYQEMEARMNSYLEQATSSELEETLSWMEEMRTA